MIHYYYGSKEKFYLALLKNAYRGIREAEQSMHVGNLDPVEAVRRITELTYDHQLNLPRSLVLPSPRRWPRNSVKASARRG